MCACVRVHCVCGERVYARGAVAHVYLGPLILERRVNSARYTRRAV